VVKDKVLKKAPYIVLLSGTNNNGKKCVTGVFCSKSVGEWEEEYGEYKIPMADDNFMFYYEEGF